MGCKPSKESQVAKENTIIPSKVQKKQVDVPNKPTVGMVSKIVSSSKAETDVIADKPNPNPVIVSKVKETMPKKLEDVPPPTNNVSEDPTISIALQNLKAKEERLVSKSEEEPVPCERDEGRDEEELLVSGKVEEGIIIRDDHGIEGINISEKSEEGGSVHDDNLEEDLTQEKLVEESMVRDNHEEEEEDETIFEMIEEESVHDNNFGEDLVVEKPERSLYDEQGEEDPSPNSESETESIIERAEKEETREANVVAESPSHFFSSRKDEEALEGVAAYIESEGLKFESMETLPEVEEEAMEAAEISPVVEDDEEKEETKENSSRGDGSADLTETKDAIFTTQEGVKMTIETEKNKSMREIE